MGAEAVNPELGGYLVLAALPLLLAACTAFTKIAVVLSALRVGLGAEALLPFGIVMALALVLSTLIMGPTGADMVEAFTRAGGLSGLSEGGPPLWLEVGQPLIDFMRAHAHAQELDFFAELSGLSNADPRVLVPAFMVSELAEALQLVVLLLIPFVLIDLIVAQALGLLEMATLPPKTVAMPAKILLFLYAGGWDLLITSVAQGYA